MTNSFKNSKVDLTTTNDTVLYTVPAESTAIVKSILVSNDDASNACEITVTLLNTVLPVFSRVTVISHALLASSFDTSIDFTIDVLSAGTVYRTVSFVVVRSTFEFLKLFVIMKKRRPPALVRLSTLAGMLCLIDQPHL